jgi:hypothetical protein
VAPATVRQQLSPKSVAKRAASLTWLKTTSNPFGDEAVGKGRGAVCPLFPCCPVFSVGVMIGGCVWGGGGGKAGLLTCVSWAGRLVCYDYFGFVWDGRCGPAVAACTRRSLG